MKPDCHIIVAAGTGSRFGAPMPKQFCDLDGRPLLMTTISRMRTLDPGSRIVLVLSEAMRPEWDAMCRRHGFDMDGITVVNGGDSRAASVANALAVVDPEETPWVDVHDGARPVITTALLDSLRGGRDSEADGVIPVVAETDSLRYTDDSGATSRSVDRSRYFRVQTPQAFPAAALISAYSHGVGPQFTDDASVMEAAGMGRFRLVEGDPRNIKVTRPGDIELASFFLSTL